MNKTGEDIFDDILMSDFKHAWTVQVRAFDGSAMLHTNEPANLQAMLATQFHDFITSERRYHVLKPVTGRSIFSSDGAFWEHSRALFRPQFSRENINDLESTDLASNKVIEAIGNADAEGWTTDTDLLPLLYNFTLDTATEFLFGKSVESQQIAIDARNGHGDAKHEAVKARAAGAEAFTKAFGVMNEGLIFRIRLQSLYWLADGPKFRRAINTVRDFTTPIVQRAVQTAASSAAHDEKKQSLLMRLATQTQDPTELRNQTLAILLAGRDTTSALLGWALTRLALHPDIFSKLRKKVLQEIEPGTDITFGKV
jgi:cytochrome P450